MKSKITEISVEDDQIAFPILARTKTSEFLKADMRFTVLFVNETTGTVVQADAKSGLELGHHSTRFDSVLNSWDWELLPTSCKVILSN